jgi:hypothetical protein
VVEAVEEVEDVGAEVETDKNGMTIASASTRLRNIMRSLKDITIMSSA